MTDARRLVTERNAAQALEYLEKWPGWTLDVETTGLRPEHGSHLVGCAIEGFDSDWGHSDALYFPFRHLPGGNVPMDFLPCLLKLVESRKLIRNWNTGFDMRICWREGLNEDSEVPIRDHMLDLHLIDENLGRGSYGLKSAAFNFLGSDSVQAETALGYELASVLGPDKSHIDRLPPNKAAPYACDDVILVRKMAQKMHPELRRQNLLNVATGISEYAKVIARMQRRGVLIDLERIPTVIKEAEQSALAAWQEAAQLAGRPVRLNNPAAVCAWLGIASSEDKYLDMIKDHKGLGPRVAVVRRYRQAVKAIGSYYRKFRDLATSDGTLHADMLLHGTIAGRLAVVDPPLQSLPRDTEVYRVKELIIPRPGYVLVSADIQRAEMCMASHYGHEENMLRILRSGKDVHAMVGQELGYPKDRAKRLNFSCIYGIGAPSLAERLNISEYAAMEYLNNYHGRYPGFRRLYFAAQDIAKRKGYITMWTGRRRHYNKGEHMTPYHKASSNLIQGGVNELMREAQTNLDKELRKQHGVHQLLQVHDSAVMEVPVEELKPVVPLIREIMEDHSRFRAPFRVDIEWSVENLANMQEAV